MESIKSTTTERIRNKRLPVVTQPNSASKKPRLALASTSTGGFTTQSLIASNSTAPLIVPSAASSVNASATLSLSDDELWGNSLNDAEKMSNNEESKSAIKMEIQKQNVVPPDDVKPSLEDLKPLIKPIPLIDVKPLIDDNDTDTKTPLLDVKPPLVENDRNLMNALNQNAQNSQSSQKGAMKAPAPKRKNQKGKKKNGANGEEESDEEDPMKNPKVFDDKPEDHMGVVETFADYKPVKLKFGKPHPDAVVESATLSSIPPGDIQYDLKIPKKIIETGALSALQLESIIYASQAHQNTLEDEETRAGFLIGMKHSH